MVKEEIISLLQHVRVPKAQGKRDIRWSELRGMFILQIIVSRGRSSEAVMESNLSRSQNFLKVLSVNCFSDRDSDIESLAESA